jgi:uncharacterized coiled-coil protein SlyX
VTQSLHKNNNSYHFILSVTVPKLNDQMAVELGANLLGEFIIFAIGAGLLILEYARQSAKETMKEQMAIQEKMELQAMLNELAFQAERQDTQIRELSRVIAELRKLFFVSRAKVVYILILTFLDSTSWTPKIISDAKNTLTDVIGLKKTSSQNARDEDNPLELLPERRIKHPVKQRVNNTANNK